MSYEDVRTVRIPRVGINRYAPYAGSIGGIYQGVKSGDPFAIGGSLVTAAAPFTGPAAPFVAAGGGFLGELGHMFGIGKRQSSNKIRTQRVKENAMLAIKAVRRGDMTGAIGAMQQVMGNMMEGSASFRKAIQATGEDGDQAWLMVDPIKKQIEKLQSGDLTEDPGGQLINSLANFVGYLDHAVPGTPVGQLREAAGMVLNGLMEKLEYTPAQLDTWDRTLGYISDLPGEKAGQGKADFTLPEEFQKMTAPMDFDRGRYAEEKKPGEAFAGGHYGTGPPAGAFGEFGLGQPEEEPKGPLTQEQYLQRNLDVGGYPGTPKYPAGYTPETAQTSLPIGYTPPPALPAQQGTGATTTMSPPTGGTLGQTQGLSMQQPQEPQQPNLFPNKDQFKTDPQTGKLRFMPTPQQLVMLKELKEKLGQEQPRLQTPRGPVTPMPPPLGQPPPTARPPQGTGGRGAPRGRQPVYYSDPMRQLRQNLRLVS